MMLPNYSCLFADQIGGIQKCSQVLRAAPLSSQVNFADLHRKTPKNLAF